MVSKIKVDEIESSQSGGDISVNSTVKVDALEAKTSGANIDINSNLRLRVLTNAQIDALTGMVEGDTVYSQ